MQPSGVIVGQHCPHSHPGVSQVHFQEIVPISRKYLNGISGERPHVAGDIRQEFRNGLAGGVGVQGGGVCWFFGADGASLFIQGQAGQGSGGAVGFQIGPECGLGGLPEGRALGRGGRRGRAGYERPAFGPRSLGAEGQDGQ